MFKKYSLVIYLSLWCFIFIGLDVNAEIINIIYEKDGVNNDNELDYNVLRNELKNLGHEVRFVDIKSKVSIWWSASFDVVEHADINIFIEGINLSLFQFAKQNFLIPNAAYDYDQNLLQVFDLILCQTQEQLNLFEDLNLSAYYLGFKSEDRFQKKIKKDFYKYLYVNEQLPSKNSIFNESVLNIWSNHPDFPLLLNFSQNKSLPTDQSLPNIKNINGSITQFILTENQNRCGVHICSSQTGKYCHSIMEGMSTGSVVVTIDAPPMNAFIQDERCLVKYQNATSVNLGISYDIDPNSLESVILNLMNLSQDELKEIGLKNKKKYNIETEVFRNNLKNLFGKVTR